MSRGLSAEFISALGAGVVRPALFFHGVFASGDLRLWSGLGRIATLGGTWTGAGQLLAISQIEDPSDVVASSITVTLSGVPDDMGAVAISEVVQGAPGRIYLGLMADDLTLIGDPAPLFDGMIDVPEIVDDGESCIITLTCEGRLAGLTTPREWRYTNESQQVMYPGDRAFEFVAGLQDKTITWGRK